MIEWCFEAVAAPVPEPTPQQLENMMRVIRGVIAYDKGKQEIRFAFRDRLTYNVLTLMNEGQTRVVGALREVLPEVNATVPLKDYLRDFRLTRAEDVVIPEDVRRFAESMRWEEQ